MRVITALVVLVTSAAKLYGANQTDQQLARLMAGIWQSPRHIYVYSQNGRWWIADDYEWLDKPQGGRGRWFIKNHQLVTDHENLSFGGFWGSESYPITKLTRHEVVFGGYRMKRISRQDVKNWSNAKHLTNRRSQPLAAAKSTLNFMKQFPMFATLAPASGGSAPSR